MASGMCASTVMLMALVPAGGHIVTTTDCYRKTRIFIETILPKMGISATVIDPADVDGLESALNKNKVSLFFTESPTNPFLRCVDIEKVSKLCHSKGTLVCIDGTFATPLNQKALALGADLVLHSATKFIGGHNDVLAGCISGSEKLVTEIRTLHHILGGTLNPNAAYLIIRGMKTLHLRVQQQNSTALRMAEVLEAHPRVKRVYYPGLPSHPEHEIAKRQMTGFGGVISFEVDGDLTTTIKFVDALKILPNPSLRSQFLLFSPIFPEIKQKEILCKIDIWNMGFLVTTLIFAVIGIIASLCTRICCNRGPSANLLHLTLVITATVCCWMMWAIVYLAQMKPLIVPILSEGE